jgi:hypothetical protein
MIIRSTEAFKQRAQTALEFSAKQLRHLIAPAKHGSSF